MFGATQSSWSVIGSRKRWPHSFPPLFLVSKGAQDPGLRITTLVQFAFSSDHPLGHVCIVYLTNRHGGNILLNNLNNFYSVHSPALCWNQKQHGAWWAYYKTKARWIKTSVVSIERFEPLLPPNIFLVCLTRPRFPLLQVVHLDLSHWLSTLHWFVIYLPWRWSWLWSCPKLNDYPFVCDPLAPDKDRAASMSSDWVF